MSDSKVTVTMRVSVHPIKAALWKNRKRIKPGMPLRQIAKMVNETSPQKIKHHLEQMVKMGSIDYIGGQYVFPKG